MSEHIYDVIVVGAGPGGSAAAHYLAAQGRDVLLLDKSDFPRDKTCGDGLTPRALHILDDMEILEEARTAGFRVNGISLFAKRGASMRAPIPSHPQYPDHLLIVPRFKLDDIVRRRALLSGAKFESPVKVSNIEVEADGVRVTAVTVPTLSEAMGNRPPSPKTDSAEKVYRARVTILAIGANMGMLHDLGILKHKPRPIVAIRAYYEGLHGLEDRIEAHFEDVPMPGYGWVFPIGKDSANIGLGMWRDDSSEQSSLRIALQSFLNGPRLKGMTAGSKLVGTIKSYPLRIDFTSAPTYSNRVLLVGETAGLVSPLTGEGIDFALESGKLAAEFLAGIFAKGDFSRATLAGYDKILRSNFQSIFTFLGLLRRVYVNPFLMDRMVRLCERNLEIKQVFVNVLMSQAQPTELLKPKVLGKLVFGLG